MDFGMMNIFSSQKFWLPPNVTWADFEDDSIHIPKVQELWVWIPAATLFLVFRSLWQRYVAAPIGRRYGVREKLPRQPEPNKTLENAFKKHRRMVPDEQGLQALSKQTDMSIRQIERWWRRKMVCNKPTEMHRLGETSFRAVVYSIMCLCGMYVIWGKPYVWDTKYCWYNYPKQHVTPEYLWYSTIEAGFYLSLLVSAAYDNRQKDFLEMMLHHVTSISMLLFAWHINFVRVSVLMAVMHDCADVFLDAAKVAKYLKMKKLPDVFFIIFTVVWILSRLIVLPLWIGWTSFFEGHYIIGLFPGYCLMAALYLVLQILHVYWFTFILRVIYNHMILKKELRDSRSDTEPDSENDENPEVKDKETDNKSMNTLVNSHANGKIPQNGHANGKVITNGHANGKVHENGHANGKVHENSHANGKVHENGLANGKVHENSHANGKVLQNGRPN